MSLCDNIINVQSVGRRRAFGSVVLYSYVCQAIRLRLRVFISEQFLYSITKLFVLIRWLLLSHKSSCTCGVRMVQVIMSGTGKNDTPELGRVGTRVSRTLAPWRRHRQHSLWWGDSLVRHTFNDVARREGSGGGRPHKTPFYVRPHPKTYCPNTMDDI